jgi:protein-tyrosine-phosphatase
MSQSTPNKITIICTANVCRSPRGERILAKALVEQDGPFSDLEVVSAGVAAREGYAASPFSVQVLAEEGIDLSDHNSQPLTQELVDESLLILCMTEDHINIIEAFFEVRENQVHLYRGFMGPKCNPQIPDPFGADLPKYKETLESIKEGTPFILNFLKTIL